MKCFYGGGSWGGGCRSDFLGGGREGVFPCTRKNAPALQCAMGVALRIEIVFNGTPQVIPFDDFSSSELHDIFRGLCREKKWHCPQDVSLVASRRVARGIGRKGFGNARAVRKLFERAVDGAKLRYRISPPVIGVFWQRCLLELACA
jgi:hypothetical protein